MKSIIPLLTAIISLLGIAGCQSSPPRDVGMISGPGRAAEAEKRGDWAAATNHWQTAVQSEPANDAFKISLTRALRMSNSCGRAAPILADLQARRPGDLSVMLEVAKCHLVSGRLDAAVASLETTIRDNPQSWEAETVLATTLDYQERHKTALTHHDRAIALAPSNPIPHSNKSLSLALAGKLTAGLKIAREAAAQPSATSRVRLNLAFLEAIAGNGDVAVMMARNEIEADETESAQLLRRIAAAAKKPRK